MRILALCAEFSALSHAESVLFIGNGKPEIKKFDIILRKTFENSPSLYLNPGMDITREILDGLNEEYRAVKGK